MKSNRKTRSSAKQTNNSTTVNQGTQTEVRKMNKGASEYFN
jgi:hypothetical protein